MTTAVTLVQGVTGAGLSGTQTPVSNASNAAASQAFVNQQILYDTATVPMAVTGGTISQYSAGSSIGTGVVLAQGTNNSTAQLLVTDGVTDVWTVA